MTFTPSKSFSLNALRAFEAAARLGSFAKAGAELNVTSGAITEHIRTLESALEVPLFSRGARGVELTEFGQSVLPEFTAAFDALGKAVLALRRSAQPLKVHIATLPAIAHLWLSPRLPKLRSAMPELSISVTTVEGAPNLKRTAYDICLFYTDTPGEVSFEDSLFPVSSPEFAARISSVEDLRRPVCLIDPAWKHDWSDWARHALGEPNFEAKGALFSLYALAVEEAVNGAGVIMAHSALIERHLASGKLVQVLEPRVPCPRYLSAWTEKSAASNEGIGLFMNWLRENQ